MSIAVIQMPDAGAPQAGVTVTGLSSPAVISVQRCWTPNEWWTVIGAKDVEAFGSYFVRDFLVPLNVPVTYRVVVHSGTISGDTEAIATVTSTTAWIQDPRDPRGAVPITIAPALDGNMLGMGALSSALYAQAMSEAQPLGARLPVASIGQRLAGAQIPVILHREIAFEGGELQRLFMDSGELAVRGAPGSLLPPVAHVAAGDASEDVVGAEGHQVSTWRCNLKQVRSGVLTVVIPWFSYAQVEALWSPATYTDAYAARPARTYLDWQADPALP